MPIQTPSIEIGDAYHAAEIHQMHRALRGYGWVEGGSAEPGSGVAVTIPDDTTMWIDGSEIDVTAGDNTANLLPHDRWPRWASVTVNDVGEVEAFHSEADRPLEVAGEELTGRSGARPSPPIITDADRVLHALVWIPANASTIDPDHVIDRRIDARVDAFNFDVAGYTDSDAIDAVTGEDPLALSGDLDVPGEAVVEGLLDVDDLVSADEYEPVGDRTTVRTDHDDPLIYRSGNDGTDRHPSHGTLNIQGRTSVGGRVQILTGSGTPELAFMVDASRNIEIPDGTLEVDGEISAEGEIVATEPWVDDNAVQNNTGDNYEIQKDGSDGNGVINLKTE